MDKIEATRTQNDQAMAKFIAIVIRNAMEDFHAQHLTDAQMKELNPIIRNAVFTAIQATRHAVESHRARAFVDFQIRLIPDYWEEPELLDDYVRSLEWKGSLKVFDPSSGVTQKRSRKIGRRDLQVGERYLHRNGNWIRIIEEIDGDTVRWSDDLGGGECSKATFLKACPSLAPE
jgi:hypothetical protein